MSKIRTEQEQLLVLTKGEEKKRERERERDICMREYTDLFDRECLVLLY